MSLQTIWKRRSERVYTPQLHWRIRCFTIIGAMDAVEMYDDPPLPACVVVETWKTPSNNIHEVRFDEWSPEPIPAIVGDVASCKTCRKLRLDHANKVGLLVFKQGRLK